MLLLPKQPPTWTETTLIFDFGYASTAMTSTAATYNAKEVNTTDEDVKGINIYLYNNQVNSALYIKDVKLEEYTPVTQ